MSEVLMLKSGYHHSNPNEELPYRALTPTEAKLLQYGQRIPFRDKQGQVREIKVNGAPKTWKRSPDRVEVPCKYGMYEYATFEAVDGKMIVLGSGVMLLVKL